MNLKKIVVALVAVALINFNTQIDVIAENDVKSIGSIELIADLKEKNIKNDVSSEDYNKPITRLEFAELLVEFYENNYSDSLEYDNSTVEFSDTKDVNALKVSNAGLMKGSGYNIFSPDIFLTKEQACVIIYRLLEQIDPNFNIMTFEDIDLTDQIEIYKWAEKEIVYVYNNRIFDLITEPNKYITKDEAIVILDRIALQKELNKVAEINNKVHYSLIYGLGTMGLPAKELLESGVGHCGDYVYLMMRELMGKGYKFRAVGLSSSYMYAAHANIEVCILGKWYTFDPTNNIYYKYSTEELITNPDLTHKRIGKYDSSNAYLQKEFYKNTYNLYYEYNTADLRDKNLALLSEGVIIKDSDKFVQPEHGLEIALAPMSYGYAAAESYILPQSFTLDFISIKEIYRGVIVWYDEQNYGKHFKLEYLDSDTNEYKSLVEEKNYVNNTGSYEYRFVLKKPIITTKIKFTLFDAHGQQRILLRNLMLFE